MRLLLQRLITIEKGQGDRYAIKIETGTPTKAGTGWSWRTVDPTLDEIREFYPEYLEFVPGK